MRICGSEDHCGPWGSHREVRAELTGALQSPYAQSCRSDQAEKLRGSARGERAHSTHPNLCWQGLSRDSCGSTWVAVGFVERHADCSFQSSGGRAG